MWEKPGKIGISGCGRGMEGANDRKKDGIRFLPFAMVVSGPRRVRNSGRKCLWQVTMRVFVSHKLGVQAKQGPNTYLIRRKFRLH